MTGRPRCGSALIEVLIGLVVLAIGGTALVTMLGQTMHSVESLRAAEIQTRAAASQLATLSILTRSELTQRVGRSNASGWSLTIERMSSDLFSVAIAASDTGLVLLRTTLYRPDTASHATP
jgi:Tfp pilus assembly protein PilV